MNHTSDACPRKDLKSLLNNGGYLHNSLTKDGIRASIRVIYALKLPIILLLEMESTHQSS
jgi:hypothetical protein